jgi:hypothetical protein
MAVTMTIVDIPVSSDTFLLSTAHDDVATGDMIAIDKDVAGTGEKGDTIILTFGLP